jgi:hypothetical protein
MSTFNGNRETILPYLSKEDREIVVAYKAATRAAGKLFCIRLSEDNSLYGTYSMTKDEVFNYYQSGGIWEYSY